MEGAAAVSGGQSALPRLLTAAETAAPADAFDVIADDLRRRFDATRVSFLIVDLTGKAVARLPATGAGSEREAERIPLFGSVHEEVIRTQRLHREATGRAPLGQMPATAKPEQTGSFGIEEFHRRVAERTGARPRTAEWDACAVLTTLAEAVSGGELNQILSRLTSGYAVLFGKADLAS